MKMYIFFAVLLLSTTSFAMESATYSNSHMIYTEIEINAPRECVWKTFMDWDHYPEWNPFMYKIEGEKKVGAPINEYLFLFSNTTTTKMSAEIVTLNPNIKFAWIGHVISSGIGNGHHQFEFVELENNKTLFIQKEEFSGVVIGPIFTILYAIVREKFLEMDYALKNRVEGINGKCSNWGF